MCYFCRAGDGWSCIALCRWKETTARGESETAAVILCILPIGSTYCCVTPSSTQAHSITYYLFYLILKTDAHTTSQNTTCSLLALYLTLRVSWQVEFCWHTAHRGHFLKLVTLRNGDIPLIIPDKTHTHTGEQRPGYQSPLCSDSCVWCKMKGTGVVQRWLIIIMCPNTALSLRFVFFTVFFNSTGRE